MRVSRNVVIPIVIVSVLAAFGCGGGKDGSLSIPDSPEGTIQAVMNGLIEHQPEILWRAMPASYQADVSELAASFAENVDPVLFERAIAVTRKGSLVLQRKKELILSTETAKNSGIEMETLDTAWEGGMLFLDAVLASDLARLEAYPSLDVEALLASSGREMMDHMVDFATAEGGEENLAATLTALENTSVELVTRDGDRATVRVSAPDEEPVDVEMVRVEDRWVPEELATQWQGMVDQTRARIEYLGSEESAQARVQALFAIGIAEGFIDQIDLMETPEDLDQLIGGILGNFVQKQGGQRVTEG